MSLDLVDVCDFERECENLLDKVKVTAPSQTLSGALCVPICRNAFGQFFRFGKKQ